MKLVRAIVAASVMVGVFVPVAAGAHPPVSASTTYYFVSCSVSDDPRGALEFSSDQDLVTLVASAARWAPGADPDVDAPILRSQGGEFSFDDATRTVRGTLDLVDAQEQPAGVATFFAQVTPTGQTAVEDENRPSRDGNVLKNVRLDTQFATVSGTVSFPDGVTYELTDCAAQYGTQSIFLTAPDAYANMLDPQSGAECTVTADGYTAELLLEGGDTVGVANLAVFPDGAELPYGFGFGEVVQGRDKITGSVPLTDVDGNALGDAALDLVLTTGQKVQTIVEQDGARYRTQSQPFELAGTLTLPNGDVIDVLGCSGAFQQGWVLITTPAGTTGR